jgi:DNA mismatch repair protein MutH
MFPSVLCVIAGMSSCGPQPASDALPPEVKTITISSQSHTRRVGFVCLCPLCVNAMLLGHPTPH